MHGCATLIGKALLSLTTSLPLKLTGLELRIKALY